MNWRIPANWCEVQMVMRIAILILMAILMNFSKSILEWIILPGLNVRDFVNDLDDDCSITSYISFLKATLGHEQTIARLHRRR